MVQNDQRTIPDDSRDILYYQKELIRAFLSIYGVIDVLDLDFRSDDPGSDLSVSCLIVIENEMEREDILEQATVIAEKKFSFKATAIKIEKTRTGKQPNMMIRK